MISTGLATHWNSQGAWHGQFVLPAHQGDAFAFLNDSEARLEGSDEA